VLHQGCGSFRLRLLSKPSIIQRFATGTVGSMVAPGAQAVCERLASC
jgi:hypothetical protein